MDPLTAHVHDTRLCGRVYFGRFPFFIYREKLRFHVIARIVLLSIKVSIPHMLCLITIHVLIILDPCPLMISMMILLCIDYGYVLLML